MSRSTTASLIVSALGMGAGCTFLVSFEDMPDAGTSTIDAAPSDAKPKDGAQDTSQSSSSSSSSSSGVDSSTDGCDRTYLEQVPGCAPTGGQPAIKDNGRVCADYPRFDGYPKTTRNNDIITCFDQKASCIIHCAGRCAHLPDGFADQCEGCSGKQNGTYCGSQMTDWPASHARLLITCSGQNMTAAAACANGCNHGECN